MEDSEISSRNLRALDLTEVIGALRRRCALLLGLVRLVVIFIPFGSLVAALSPVVELVDHARFAFGSLQPLQLLS